MIGVCSDQALICGEQRTAIMGKIRVDRLLVERGLVTSRAKAQAAIVAGHVLSAGRVIDSASAQLDVDVPLELHANAHPYVSRGGLKLAHALDQFAIDVAGVVAVDLGSSTGGFTDVLLRRGVARVYAVDVGHGQLAPALAADPRVIVRDGINARALCEADIPEPIDLIVCDVSFIGLRLALPPALDLAVSGAHLVALIKPQFEVGRAHIGKGGIVRDQAAREAARNGIAAWLAAQHGWRVFGLTESPVQGGSGNIEYLIGARRDA